MTIRRIGTKRGGFTLIELLLTVAIISLLVAASAVKYGNLLGLVRDKIRRMELSKMQNALAAYYTRFGHYPSTGELGTWYSSEVGDTFGNNNNGNYIPGFAPMYLSKLPRDPLGGPSALQAGQCAELGAYRAYTYTSDGQSYKLMSHCSQEETWEHDDVFFDPKRPDSSWMVCGGEVGCQQ